MNFRNSKNLSSWSIQHPRGIVMIILALMLIGVFAFKHLKITLLPDIIYPDIRVRVLDTGVPASIMEDTITRQLEEQLAITENAVSVRSHTSQGRSAVDLGFPYGTDINAALRDASSRLDRAKRFLPESIQPPIIYKRDPAQIPVMELIASSTEKSPVQLYQWTDYILSKWFINLPGVASLELGGGLIREVQVVVDEQRLANYGLNLQSLSEQIKAQNQNLTAGRLYSKNQEFSIRTDNQLTSALQLKDLPIKILANNSPAITKDQQVSLKKSVHLSEIAKIVDTHEDERLSIRLNGTSGIKLSIQKQPAANTVQVVEHINNRLQQLKNNKLIGEDIQIAAVSDQSTFIRHALNNASKAAINGTLLAMLVVLLFLGDWRKTLIIGSAIPIAILITFTIMDLSGLTLNIMTLGGLALGIGMLVDNTIVMLENINRHLINKSFETVEGKLNKIIFATGEISSALVASTSTNLVAVLPFLFIGGLIGLFFKDLIITISAAIIASLLVSLTLVPSLAARLSFKENKITWFKRFFSSLISHYQKLIQLSFRYSLLIIFGFILLLVFSIQNILQQKQIFLPRVDEGRVRIDIRGEYGMKLAEMNELTMKVESLLFDDPLVETVTSMVGGSVFGRTQVERSNRSTIKLQLLEINKRIKSDQQINSKLWIEFFRKKLDQLKLPGIRFKLRVDSVRGIRFGNSMDEVEIRIQGKDINVLSMIADQIIEKIKENQLLNKQLKNLGHSYDEQMQELIININRNRASDLDITDKQIANAVKAAISGVSASELIEGDKSTNILVRLDKSKLQNTSDLNNIHIKMINSNPVYLRDVANIELKPAPISIEREYQQRINEITASIRDDNEIEAIMQQINMVLQETHLPDGYTVYPGGSDKELREGKDKSVILLILAFFLVFTVMVVQYESLRNPLVILLGIPFTLTGVSFIIQYLQLPLSMPVWLGLIMLTGIVVNNSIVLIEQIEICKKNISQIKQAISTAASLRIRAILMTSLTTVFGMLPLALGIGSGTEMLQPLAIVIVAGLSYSVFVSLILIPNIYYLFYRK